MSRVKINTRERNLLPEKQGVSTPCWYSKPVKTGSGLIPQCVLTHFAVSDDDFNRRRAVSEHILLLSQHSFTGIGVKIYY